jgi:hypothetical protein
MRKNIGRTALAITFVPFALLLSAALLAAEQAEGLDHARLIYTTWVSLTFAIPALALFVFPGTRRGPYELLTWTFSYAAYMVHFYYAFGLNYHFSVALTYAGQGPVIATSNLLVTALWTLDVAASWWFDAQPRWLDVLHVAIRTLVFVTFVASGVILFGGFVRVLGVTMIVVVSGAIAFRAVRARRSPTTAERRLQPGASIG